MQFDILHEMVRDRSRNHFLSNDLFLRGEMQAYREARRVVAIIDQNIRDFSAAYSAMA